MKFQPYVSIDENGHFIENSPPEYRGGMSSIRNFQEFYSSLLNLKKLSELDRIALNLETDNQFLMTVIDILLLDRGIDLHDYNMNFTQNSLTFHSGGLTPTIFDYLGIKYLPSIEY